MTESTGVATTVREVALTPGGEVSINLTSSDVRVNAVDGDVVTIRTRGGEDIDDEILVENEPGRVFVRDAERGYRIGPVRFGSGGSVALDVDVPRTARLICKTLSGDIEAHGVGHESRWSTASGDLHLVVEGGSLILDTMSGDATVESSGPIGIRARTVSGDLRLSAPRIEALQASSTSGDVRIDADLGSGFEHVVTSVSGDVFLQTTSPVRLETQTIAGDVRATGLHSAEGGRGRRTIIVGDGSVRVGARTTSGDIRLEGRGKAGIPPIPGIRMPDVPKAPAAPAMPNSPPCRRRPTPRWRPSRPSPRSRRPTRRGSSPRPRRLPTSSAPTTRGRAGARPPPTARSTAARPPVSTSSVRSSAGSSTSRPPRTGWPSSTRPARAASGGSADGRRSARRDPASRRRGPAVRRGGGPLLAALDEAPAASPGGVAPPPHRPATALYGRRAARGPGR